MEQLDAEAHNKTLHPRHPSLVAVKSAGRMQFITGAHPGNSCLLRKKSLCAAYGQAEQQLPEHRSKQLCTQIHSTQQKHAERRGLCSRRVAHTHNTQCYVAHSAELFSKFFSASLAHKTYVFLTGLFLQHTDHPCAHVRYLPRQFLLLDALSEDFRQDMSAQKRNRIHKLG